ncbi:hypothetical protein [Neisseria iguanae]|uniref:hypothetical protein n=1 Tax=Neisseria iguanae TaxID=90242 RepID=UPI0011B23F77
MSGEILSRIQNKTLHGDFFLGNINQRGICSLLFLQNLPYSLICPQGEEATIRANPKSLESYTWIEMSGVSGRYWVRFG